MAAELGLFDELADNRRIGDYRLIKELGRGGMGIVWLAEQTSLGRRVALKVIRPGLGTEDLARRLQNEAAILGHLQHSGIAHVYEAGKVELSPGFDQPYFAMEFVDGTSLSSHLAEHEGSVADRLALFGEICDAVDYAHDHGVIHRDLKPDNILVDALGHAKILDFGIARAIDCEVSQMSMRTATGQVLGTLPYMSPEQVTGDGCAVDARTDVYALGAILYEVLTGHVPVDVAGKSIAEAARLIHEQEPTRLANHRGELRGDLETIVNKALAKEVQHRYSSVADLSTDIRHFLAHEPIVARSPTTFYYLRKFARRNKPLIAGLSAAFVIAIVGAIVAVTFAIRSNRNEAVAVGLLETKRRLANTAALVAAEIALRGHDTIGARHALAAHDRDGRGWEWHHLASRLDDRLGHAPPDDLGELWMQPLANAASFLVTFRRNEKLEQAHWNPLDDSWSDLGSFAPAAPRLAEMSIPVGGARRVVSTHPDNGAVIVRATPQNGPSTHWFVERETSRPPRRVTIPTKSVWIRWATPTRVAGCSGGQAFVLDLVRDARHVLPSDGDSPSCVYAHTGSGRVVVGCHNGTLRVFDGRSAKLLATDRSQHKRIYAAAFYADGMSLATAGWDGTVRIFETDTLRPLRVLLGDGRALSHITVSGDGSHVSSRPFGVPNEWFTWDANLSDPRVLRGHSSYVYAVAVSPDGQRLASGGWYRSSEAELRTWDLRSRSASSGPARTIDSHLCAVAYSPDGRRVATIDETRHIRVWEVTCGVAALVAERAAYPGSRHGPITFHPDSTRILWPGTDELQIWDTANDVVATATTDELRALRSGHAAADGSVLVVRDASPGMLRCLDTQTRTARSSFRSDGTYQNFALQSIQDNRVVILVPRVAANLTTGRRTPRDVAVVDPQTGREVSRMSHGSEVMSIAVSPDGKRIATGCRDALIHIWNASTYEEIVTLAGHHDYVMSLAWSPDGSTLVSGSGDHTIRVWDTMSTRAVIRDARRAR